MHNNSTDRSIAEGQVRAYTAPLGTAIPTTTILGETPEQARCRWHLVTFSRAATATRRHVYGGTVPARTVSRRRAANKAARAARRAGR